MTYVPARNTVFLSLALAWAEALGVFDIGIGANALDYSGYPDCRPEYLRAFETMANLATKAGVEGGRFHIHAPLLAMTKAEIIRRGLELGVDYGLTHSCYDPEPDGRPCGRCDSCVLRAKGLCRGRGRRPARGHCIVTTRLYYSDSRLVPRSTRTVTESGTLPDGRPFVVLDQTAFYPTSGGQPHDIGTLGGATVVDVVDRDEDGAVRARARSPARPGRRCLRRDRLGAAPRPHPAAHAASTCCRRRSFTPALRPTVSFHLGADVSTIDLIGDARRRSDHSGRGRGQPDRLGEPACRRALRERRGGGGAAAPEGTETRRHAAPRRHRGLGSVGLRRHPRLADRQHRRHRGHGLGALQGRHARRLRLRRPGGPTSSPAPGRRHRGDPRLCPFRSSELPDAVRRLQADAREARQQMRGLAESLAKYEAAELASAAEEIAASASSYASSIATPPGSKSSRRPSPRSGRRPCSSRSRAPPRRRRARCSATGRAEARPYDRDVIDA